MFGYWPPLLYFVFIVLSTLRLDFWLSLWTGAVAAMQQMCARPGCCRSACFGTTPEATPAYHYCSRSSVLLRPGVVAGIVAGSLRRQFENSVAAAAARDRYTTYSASMFRPRWSTGCWQRQFGTAERDADSVCVLFLDIRGFTAMTRTRPAVETVALLNDFFAEMVRSSIVITASSTNSSGMGSWRCSVHRSTIRRP